MSSKDIFELVKNSEAKMESLMARMTENPENNQTRKLFEFIVLQSLDTKPMLEGELISYIGDTFGILMSQKTINETLEDLAIQGLVRDKVVEPDEPPEPYRLTSKGRNTLTKTESTLISTCKELNPKES